MSAPERIWATVNGQRMSYGAGTDAGRLPIKMLMGGWSQDQCRNSHEYIRADLFAAQIQAAVLAETERLAQWHDKRADECRLIAKDEPRLDLDTRKRAALFAAHHGSCAAAFRSMTFDAILKDMKAKA